MPSLSPARRMRPQVGQTSRNELVCRLPDGRDVGFLARIAFLHGSPRLICRYTREQDGKNLRYYWTQVFQMSLKSQCRSAASAMGA